VPPWRSSPPPPCSYPPAAPGSAGHGRTATFADGAADDEQTGVRLVASGADGTEVRFAAEDDPPPLPPTLDFATPVGDAVDITPQGALPPTEVRMTVDPGRAGAADGFIAVYNTTAGTWLPLSTRYDERTHELVAPAPHLSLYWRLAPRILTVPNVKVYDALADRAVTVLRTMRTDLLGRMRLKDTADCGAGRWPAG
jgi:hypothetical protein